MTKGNAVVSVPAGDERFIGPFPTGAFNDAAGKVQITYDDVTSITIAALRMRFGPPQLPSAAVIHRSTVVPESV